MFDVVVVADGGDVAGLVFGEGCDGFEGGVGIGELSQEVAASPPVGEGLHDAEVGEGLPRGMFDLADGAEAALGVDEGAVFFAPAGGGEEEVSHLSGFGAGIHVLHHEVVELLAHAGEGVLGDPRVVGIGGDDPEAFDFAAVDGVDDLVVGVAGRVLDLVVLDAHVVADFGAVVGIGEVVSAEEVGGV